VSRVPGAASDVGAWRRAADTASVPAERGRSTAARAARQGRALLCLAGLALLTGCAVWPRPAVGPPEPPPPVLLQVDAPPALRTLLERHLDLARLAQLRGDDTLDDSEWTRLLAAAPAQVRELAQTEGYFDAQVRIERTPGNPPRVRVIVEPGPQVRVAQLQVQTAGPLEAQRAAGDATARALTQSLSDLGPLTEGRVFRDADWRETKVRLLTRLRAAGYASAAVSASAADVDVPAVSAALQLELDSGPLYLAGPLRIEGLQHHDDATVRHLAGFGPGAPLTEARLLDYQDRLQKSGLFEAISVTFEPDPSTAEATAISVRLKELPLRQATVGLGYSTSAGPRTSLELLHRRPFGWAATAYNQVEWGRDLQRWNSDFQTHPGEGFYRNLLGVQLERLKGEEDTVLTQRLRLGRTTDTPRIERLYFGEVLRSRQEPSDGPVIDARAYSANIHWLGRQLDSVLLPTRGYAASLQLGAGMAQSNAGQSGPFARVYARLTGYLPIGADWYGSARVEAGQVIKRDAVLVPDALGFRAGGDESVRGYGYRELAPERNGRIIGGDVLLTGSVELARPVAASLPAVWGAVFVDAGRAASAWNSYKPAFGYGVGVRWRSPIGPLRADLAYGEEIRKLRLHLSVGITF
jgi:translocation and assembly module TamA